MKMSCGHLKPWAQCLSKKSCLEIRISLGQKECPTLKTDELYEWRGCRDKFKLSEAKKSAQLKRKLAIKKEKQNNYTSDDKNVYAIDIRHLLCLYISLENVSVNLEKNDKTSSLSSPRSNFVISREVNTVGL